MSPEQKAAVHAYPCRSRRRIVCRPSKHHLISFPHGLAGARFGAAFYWAPMAAWDIAQGLMAGVCRGLEAAPSSAS